MHRHLGRRRACGNVSALVLALTFVAYLLGALMGLAADRGGPRLRRDWPVYLRVQLVASSVLLGLFSAWRLTAPRELVAPIAVSGVAWVLMAAALVWRGERSRGLAGLESWAAYPNGNFWVLPMAGALAGPTGSMISALANAAYSVPNGISIHLMRRDAPIRQRGSTTWGDQSALLAVVVGLVLHLAGPAPAASHWVLVVAGPVLAFVGAALFTGSVLHPHNTAVGRPGPDRRRWLWLVGVRLAYLMPIAVFTRSSEVAVVAVLSALGAPAFNPPQQAVMYGYRSGVVNIAVRWGWLALPVGLAAALVLR